MSPAALGAPGAPGMASRNAHWRPALLLLLLVLLSASGTGSGSRDGGAREAGVDVEVEVEKTGREEELEQQDGKKLNLGGRLRADLGGSSSVLAALLDSDHHLMLELLEKAGILQPLESLVATAPLTIFAPNLDRCDPAFKRWLLEPANIQHLQKLLQHHVVIGDIPASEWQDSTVMALSEEPINLFARGGGSGRVSPRRLFTERVEVVAPDAIVREDGRVHGLEELIVPRAVRKAYSLYKRYGPAAPSPHESAPAPAFIAFPDYLSPYAPAPAPGLAPAFAPAPGPSAGVFRGTVEEEVQNFVETVAQWGGYREVADLIANLTSLATDLTLLVEAGHKFTLLAPTDEALLELSSKQLSVAGDIENILWYHVIPEYLTEEAIYNTVRKARTTQVVYPTLRRAADGRVYTLPARELDGTVEFGVGKHGALILDHELFADGRISVIGINNVLFPPGTVDEAAAPSPSGVHGRRLNDLLPDFSILSEQPNAGVSVFSNQVSLISSAFVVFILSCLLGA